MNHRSVGGILVMNRENEKASKPMNKFLRILAVAALVSAPMTAQAAQPVATHVLQSTSTASCQANFYPIDMATKIEFSQSFEILNAPGTPCGQLIQPGY
jgi:hypothetical protein